MKANEFVKKFGWDAIKHDLSFYLKEENVGTIQILTKESEYIEVDGDGLKRLVESHELVESYGGLESSKLTVNYPNFLNDEDVKTTNLRLSKAIADVESCM